MFKHILIPVDGSEFSLRAVSSGTELAQAVGAKVTLLYVRTDYGRPYFAHSPALLGKLAPKDAKSSADLHAQKVLDTAKKAAGMDVQTKSVRGVAPYEEIVESAAKLKCDLIVMASHGHGGLAAVLLGSETQKVLTHTKVPVLVIR